MKMDWIALLKILGDALAPLIRAYAESRKLAAQDGVTAAQLAEADARWTWNFEDPLAQPDKPEPPDEPPMPTAAVYMKFLPLPIPDDAELLARGYKVGDAVVPAVGMPEWLVVRKGQPLLGMVALRVIRDPKVMGE